MSDTEQETEATVVSFPDGQAAFVIDPGTENEATRTVEVPKVKPFVLTHTYDDSFTLVRQRASSDLVTYAPDQVERVAEVYIDGTVTLASVGGNNVFWTLEPGDYVVLIWRDSDGEVARIEFRQNDDA